MATATDRTAYIQAEVEALRDANSELSKVAATFGFASCARIAVDANDTARKSLLLSTGLQSEVGKLRELAESNKERIDQLCRVVQRISNKVEGPARKPSQARETA